MATQDRSYILAVDDEPAICESLWAILRTEGFEVTTMVDGWKAFELICEDPSKFDLVITDVWMPGCSGIKLMEGLKERGIELPVLPMTGYKDDHYFDHMRTLGCRHVLLKPFDRETLMRMIGWTLRGADAAHSLVDCVEMANHYVTMADLESPKDLSALSEQVGRIQNLLEVDGVENDVPALSDANLLDACRQGAVEAARILSEGFSTDGTQDSAVDVLHQSLAMLQAVICRVHTSDKLHDWLKDVPTELNAISGARNSYDNIDDFRVALTLISGKRASSQSRANISGQDDLKTTVAPVCETTPKEEKEHA